MKRKVQFRKMAMGLLLPLLTLSTHMIQGQNARIPDERYGAQAELMVPGASRVAVVPGESFPSQVRMRPDRFIPVGEFETFLRAQFRFGSAFQFERIKEKVNETGLDLIAYQLLYKGIPIEHGIVRAHARNGLVERFGGFAGYPDLVSLAPAVDEAAALETAKERVGARKFLWEVPEQEAFLKSYTRDDQASYYPKGELILVRAEISTSNAKYRLAWQFDVRDAESILDRRVLVDAETGAVIRSYSLVYDCDAGTVATTWHGTHNFFTDYVAGDNNYKLLDDCGTASIHTILEAGGAEITDADNNWTEDGVRDFASTHFYARATMDYYATAHSRNSYDDADGDLLLRHVAGWANGSYIGSGTIRIGMNTGNVGEFYNTLDVVAHEFTHAVTANNGLGGLVYQGESGALNEAYSDILGETAEMWFENGAYPIDWLHREDYVNGENRSLVDPKAKGQPDTYLGDNWANTCLGCPDEGGVHTNSGVMNHWFYLLCVGDDGTNDNGDDYSVDPISLTDARELVYRMLTEEMSPNATYADARTAAIDLAIDIHGDCSYELKQVMNAWYAVGVGNPYCEVTLESPQYAGGYNVSCNGYSDGEINLTIAGTGPFTIVWDDGPTSSTRSGLSAGTYTVTVTDDTGCSDTKSITLTEPPLLTIEAGDNQTVYFGYPPMACATLSYSGAGGGVPPYSFAWSTGETTQDIVVCPEISTLYTVTITDANGCMATDEVIVCAIDVRCGKKLDKVELCHIPPDNPANQHTLCVALSAVPDLLSQGDILAACGTDHSCTDLLPKTAPAPITAGSDPVFSLTASPNPFNGLTRITFVMETDGKAMLKLSDSYGNSLATLFESTVAAYAPQTLELDGSVYAPGLYYLRLLQSDGATKVIKLIVY